MVGYAQPCSSRRARLSAPRAIFLRTGAALRADRHRLPGGLSTFDIGTLNGDLGYDGAARHELSRPFELPPILDNVGFIAHAHSFFGAVGQIFLSDPTALEQWSHGGAPTAWLR